MVFLFLKDIFFVALQAASALGLGRLALRSYDGSADEAFVLRLGIGYALSAFVTFFLGIAGLLTPWAILAFWAAGWFLLLLPAGSASPDKAFWRALLEPRGMFLLLLAALAGNLLYAHAPFVMDDSVYIYIALPQAYVKAGRLIEIPENAHAYFPASIEMLYTQLMLFTSAQAAKLLNWAFGALSVLVATRIAWKRLKLRRLGFVAACVYTMPWVTSLTGTGKIDLGFLFFSLLSCAALLDWLAPSDGDRSLYLCAFLAGAAFATKYTGAAVVLVVERRPCPGYGASRALDPASPFAPPWLWRPWRLGASAIGY